MSVLRLDEENYQMMSSAGDRMIGTFAIGYHEVSVNVSEYYYSSSLTQFHEQLEMLAARCWFSSNPSGRCLVTFDDGYVSNYRHAFPLLERFGVKATFFVVADSIGSNPRFLTWAQARELVAAGHSVQSHTRSHRFLTQCSAEDLESELAGSKAKIEDALGVEVSCVSAPGGRWNKRVVEAAEDAGYHRFYHSNPWEPPRLSGGGITLQGRLMVTNRMLPEELEREMRSGRLRKAALRAKFALKDEMRRLVGDETYHRLWCRFANFKDDSGMRIQLSPDEQYRKEGRRA